MSATEVVEGLVAPTVEGEDVFLVTDQVVGSFTRG